MDKVYNFSTGNAPGSFNDLYTKYERLGRGGFGYVFKVEHNPTKEILAVKEIRDVGDLSKFMIIQEMTSLNRNRLV